MAEFVFGRDGRPVGPEVDGLNDERRHTLDECTRFFMANVDRMIHFTDRVTELGRTGLDTVITLIDVDDPTGHGRLLADMLMPGEDWQQYRDRGETPVARGLAAKDPFPEILDELGYRVAASALRSTDELSIIVLHAQTVQVVEAQFD